MGTNAGIKEKVISLLMEKDEKEPLKVKRFSEQIFRLLEQVKHKRTKFSSSFFTSSETQIEKAFKAIMEYVNGKRLRKKELLLHLARIAGMERRNQCFYEALDKFIKDLYPKGLPNKKIHRTINKQSSEDMVVYLKKGIKLGITRGGDPVWIEIDHTELKKREGLTSMIGIFSDSDPEASIKHDKLLYGQ